MSFVICLWSGGWLTTEGENGHARSVLYRNFLFKCSNRLNKSTGKMVDGYGREDLQPRDMSVGLAW